MFHTVQLWLKTANFGHFRNLYRKTVRRFCDSQPNYFCLCNNWLSCCLHRSDRTKHSSSDNCMTAVFVVVSCTWFVQDDQECKNTWRQEPAIHIEHDGCRSLKDYRPKYCSTCRQERCCRPDHTKTLHIEMRCAGDKTILQNFMWIKSCRCAASYCKWLAVQYLDSDDEMRLPAYISHRSHSFPYDVSLTNKIQPCRICSLPINAGKCRLSCGNITRMLKRLLVRL